MRESRHFWSCLVASWAIGCRGTSPAQQMWPSDGSDVANGAAGTPDGAPASHAGSAAKPGPDGSDGQGGDSGLRSEPAGAAVECGGEPVTLAEMHAGSVRGGVRIAVEPLVASSQKFLVSEAKSGSCLWGALAAHPTHVGRGSGLFLVSFGAPHADGEPCRSGSDGLPDDLEPGDVLEVEGLLDDFVPAACDGVAPGLKLRIESACAARRTGRGEPPSAVTIDAATATEIAKGASVELLRDWGGALVRLENVSALRDESDGDAIFPYGVMRLEQTPLEVHSRIYYFDLSEGGPRAGAKAPRFEHPLSLTRVTGHVLLDYCTWALAPRSVCTDFEPPGGGCPR